MGTFEVKNRDFQRAPGDWLQKVKEGNTVVIISAEGPPVTLSAGRPARNKAVDWNSHFDWLHNEPPSEMNPVSMWRRVDKR